MTTKAEKLKAAARSPRPPPPATPANFDDFVSGAKPPAPEPVPAAPAKRGRGRPRRTEKRTPVTAHLAPELHKALRLAKVEEDREMSEIVSDALRDYFKAKGYKF